MKDSAEIIERLKKEVRAIERPKTSMPVIAKAGLGVFSQSFPDNTFPLACVHECISYNVEDAAATNAFITGITSKLSSNNDAYLWISLKRTVFPSALAMFGIDPSRVVFVTADTNKQALWLMEEGLRCEAVAVAICEVSDVTFNQSRRLQLAVEECNTTGFIHRSKPRSENTLACSSRWKVKLLPSQKKDLIGITFPSWNVDLVKVRNGKPASWQIEWIDGDFKQLNTGLQLKVPYQIKTAV